jgi:hypothetical protein
VNSRGSFDVSSIRSRGIGRRAPAYFFLLVLIAQTLFQLTPVALATNSSPAAAPAVVPSLPAQLSVTLDDGFGGEFYTGFNGAGPNQNPQDLTAAGTTDWRTWGENTNTVAGDDRKVGGAGISNLTNIDPAPSISLRSLGNLGLIVGNGAGSVPFSFGWSDGTPVASAAAARAGLQHNNSTSSLAPGYGFSFTVPATASLQRLTLWVSSHHGTGRITASVGDNTHTDTGVSGGQNHGGVYTIEFSGDGTPGQQLNVSFVLDSAVTPSSTLDSDGYQSTEANVVIYAAALSLLSTPPSVAIYSAAQAPSDPAVVGGRLTGDPSTDYTMRFRTANSCDGAPDGANLGTMSTATNATGNAYFQNEVSTATALQTYVVAQVVGIEDTPLSDWSPCIVAGPDNDTWPRALEIGPGSLTGYVDDVGRARWYKVPIQPGSRIHVNVSNLPADYDMFLFTDIGQAFAELANTDDLTRLSAEFAPSAFSPSAFSPSAFSPSAFSPSAFSPSAFSPSAFSPSAFSPSAFSPSAFSPSAFSPSAFSPSAFSPSAFSPSAFSPSAFSPSAFSPSAFSAETYASAQIRSLITGSAASGLTNETVVADTWNNTGYFYIRVSGKNGAFSIDSPFTLGVTLDPSVCDGVFPEAADSFIAPAGGYETLVLTDFSRMPSALAGNSTADKAALTTKLTTFKGRSEIDGAVEDVGTHARIQALNGRADTHTSCMYAKNLVADAIYDVIAEYRDKNPGLKYIVIVGGDGAIPFFRYPDQTLLGPESEFLAPVLPGTASNASLRANYVLGQDGYGASFDLSLHGSAFPIPDLPVGRLVETAAEASGMVDAYLSTTGGTVATPTKSLVTGYDFLSDAATAVQSDLATGLGTGGTPETLISAKDIAPGQLCDATHLLPNCSWNATAMRNALLNTRHDLVFLAGHFSANNALAADFQTTISTADLAASSVNLVNAIVFSAGCHSGYNVVDPDAVIGGSVDWAQTLARKKATFIGGTGYQYGDTDFLEYSERIYAEFAHQLRVGSGPVSIGDALLRAKQIYLASTPDIRGLHTKALLESAIFGLPMLSVNMPPAGRDLTSGPGSIINAGDLTEVEGNPGGALGLKYVDPTIAWTLTPHTVVMNNLGGGTVTAKYYSGTNGVVTNPGEPAIPVVSKNVSVPDEVLRGIGFRGGSYIDETLIPLTGAPADPDKQLRGIHRGFASPVFFPMRLATPNYFGALSGGSTNLLITPAQHRGTGANDGSAVLRRYTGLDLRLFYSDYTGASAASGAPTITSVSAAVAGGFVTFSARAFGDPSAGMQQVWATYTGNANTWTSVDLVQDLADSTLWTKTIPLPAAESGRTIDFLVQAVNGVGLVSLDDNLGRTYSVLEAGEKANQTVTIAAPAVKALADPDFSVSAASTSGLPVTLSAAGVCTVSGTTVHITAGGICTLTGTQAGNAVYKSATGTATIQVRWPFTGFFSPVDNPPVDNVATAGSAIPVKFSLGGNRGLGVLVAGSPTATKFTCGSEPTDLIEELVTATASSFTYDAASGQYKYIWKTPKTYAGLCYQLKFTLVDGSTQVANFKFK